MSNFKGIASAFALSATLVFGAGSANASESVEEEINEARLVTRVFDFQSIIGNVLGHLKVVGNQVVSERVYGLLTQVARRLEGKGGGGEYFEHASRGALIALCGEFHGGRIKENVWEDNERSIEVDQSVELVDRVTSEIRLILPAFNALVRLQCVSNALERYQDSEGFVYFAGLRTAIFRVSQIVEGGFGGIKEHRLDFERKVFQSQILQ